MHEAAAKALEFCQGKSQEEIRSDEMRYLAVVQLIEVLGEAARGITPEFREQNPTIPWSNIIGTRDRLSHAYYNINFSIVYSIVSNDLPPLVRQLEAILEAGSV